jgi:hypothetical protein
MRPPFDQRPLHLQHLLSKPDIQAMLEPEEITMPDTQYRCQGENR